MGRFVEGAQRSQTTLLPECLDDFIAKIILCGLSTHSSKKSN
jgi:hypothetical protein